jgi:hypothetical protein
MVHAAIDASTLPDALTVVGSAGTVIGATIGAIVGATSSRRALECLALGAAAGSVGGYLAVFVIYDGIRVLG